MKMIRMSISSIHCFSKEKPKKSQIVSYPKISIHRILNRRTQTEGKEKRYQKGVADAERSRPREMGIAEIFGLASCLFCFLFSLRLSLSLSTKSSWGVTFNYFNFHNCDPIIKRQLRYFLFHPPSSKHLPNF